MIDSWFMAPGTAPSDVTQLLQQWAAGDQEAFDRASTIIYPELRRIAHTYLTRERPGHTLQPTALINEAFVRLKEMGSLRVEGRQQFYALSARLMRQILVDHARTVKAVKRGGGKRKVLAENAIGEPVQDAERFLAIHEALDELWVQNKRKAQLIELRHFGGFTLEEAAGYLGISRSVAQREQRVAEAWLAARIPA